MEFSDRIRRQLDDLGGDPVRTIEKLILAEDFAVLRSLQWGCDLGLPQRYMAGTLDRRAMADVGKLASDAYQGGTPGRMTAAHHERLAQIERRRMADREESFARDPYGWR